MITQYMSTLSATEIPASGLQGGEIITQQPVNRVAFGNGTGLGQANKTYSENTTLAANGTETIDLNAFGGANDALGEPYDLTAIKGIMIRNTSTDPSAILTVAPGASNGWTALTGSTSNAITSVTPNNGEWTNLAPSAAGLPVSGTSKTLKLTNASGSAALTFELMVIGAQ